MNKYTKEQFEEIKNKGYFFCNEDEKIIKHILNIKGFPKFSIAINGDNIYDNKGNTLDLEMGYINDENGDGYRYLDIDKQVNIDFDTMNFNIDINKSKKAVKKAVNDYIDYVYKLYEKQFI